MIHDHCRGSRCTGHRIERTPVKSNRRRWWRCRRFAFRDQFIFDYPPSCGYLLCCTLKKMAQNGRHLYLFNAQRRVVLKNGGQEFETTYFCLLKVRVTVAVKSIRTPAVSPFLLDKVPSSRSITQTFFKYSNCQKVLERRRFLHLILL